MKSTGEVMAIERTFEAALNKALRALEQRLPDAAQLRGRPDLLHQPNDRRLFAALQALRDGLTDAEVAAATGYAPWFTERLRDIVALENRLGSEPLDAALYRDGKRSGFSDAAISELSGGQQLPSLLPTFRQVDPCAAEFDAQTPYYYSCYEEEDEVAPGGRSTAIVIGSGPIRIGQGIEFDYCSVHASNSLRQAGWDSVLVNSNPETVSTDFDASKRPYFRPPDLAGGLGTAWPRVDGTAFSSTATRRPSPPTSTPPHASTSSRSTWRVCSGWSPVSVRPECWCSSAGRPASTWPTRWLWPAYPSSGPRSRPSPWRRTAPAPSRCCGPCAFFRRRARRPDPRK